ncbi:hypothetical protein WG906_17330 [Pedobacter sp. P351]|uniref:hypothetical protein n=1 Tax=Pedobacter superstes TaxID=3133441 RepID=UPI0030B37CDE
MGGQDWLKPIQLRLAAKVDSLSSSDLDEYNNLSQEVLKVGFGFISTTLKDVCDRRETIKETDLKSALINEMSSKFPWLSNDNLKRILSQGLYYAWKDGLGNCIK